VNRNLANIAARLSLRAPQRESLEILARVVEIATPSKDVDLAGALAAVRSHYASVQEFEREFLSLCFHLATGVGKTRLMGAFIAWLYAERVSRHFFVLAPNLTIYEKLHTDFTQGTPKYVFQGLAEFTTTPPVIVTGDNYESGIGVRDEARRQMTLSLEPGDGQAVHINVFNIAKINSEVRGGKQPRIKRLAEYIGESYFEYLAGLPDLVLLMDESHRYRADAGIRAINELKPILGLELTATPFTERAGRPVPFKNVVYSYPLGRAIDDGFVKIPAVATRQNFDARQAEATVERIKLEDGVRLHEELKTELAVYAAQTGRPLVKPFIMVIARDTAHARALHETIASAGFFGGQYAGKVVEIHSQQGTEEKEENVRRLLDVERADEPTEIVIHVDMLKEGWDVTNLFTIVPLRAANARTLIEQSIGRGLRLPYGRRTGDNKLDRLTIVAHDRFQEIVDEANKPDSVVKLLIVELDPGGPPPPAKPVLVPPVYLSPTGTTPGTGAAVPKEQQAVLDALQDAIAKQAQLGTSADLLKPDVQAKVLEQVKAALPVQYALPMEPHDIKTTIAEVTKSYIARTIDIPRITVVATGEVTIGYRPFDLDLHSAQHQPVDEAIFVQHLGSPVADILAVATSESVEKRLEDYLVRELIAFDDIDYDAHSELLYKLAGDVVANLRRRLANDDEVANVLLYYAATYAELVHAQLEQHRVEHGATYVAKVTQGFTPVRSALLTLPQGESPRDFRVPLTSRSEIPRMLFGGFAKCVYPLQKFQSDPERRFAVVLESGSNKSVLKWVKPAPGSFQIELKRGATYNPDFVVETDDARWICEVKDHALLEDVEVLDKARAAITWCERASEHTKTTDGKLWRYMLVPDNVIADSITFAWLAKQYERSTNGIQ